MVVQVSGQNKLGTASVTGNDNYLLGFSFGDYRSEDPGHVDGSNDVGFDGFNEIFLEFF